jgi:UV DNA damage endonuclease
MLLSYCSFRRFCPQSCSLFSHFRTVTIKKHYSFDFLTSRKRLREPQLDINMPPKRKRSSAASVSTATANGLSPILHETPIPPPVPVSRKPPPPKRQASRRSRVDTNPDHNADIIDGKAALRASPDADEKGEALDMKKVNAGPPFTSAKTNGVKANLSVDDSDSPLSDLEEVPAPTPAKKQKKTPTKSSIAAKKGSDEIKAFKAEQAAKKSAETKIKKEEDGDEWDKKQDPDGDDAALAEDVDTLRKEAARPPPVNSDYLPLPWKGRLGYVSTALKNT